MDESRNTPPKDDLIRITQIAIERRRRVAEQLERERKARWMETVSVVLTFSGILTIAAACLCVETSETACIIGSLIGFALLMAAAVAGGCVRR